MSRVGATLQKNQALANHLQTLAKQGSATDEEVEQIRVLAGKLSADEGTEIRQVLKSLQISDTARAHIDEYMLDQLEKRLESVEHSKSVGDLFSAVTLGITVVGVPVLNHFLAIKGLDTDVGLATNAVQFALLAGEYLGGYAAVRAVGAHFKKSDYGEQD